MKNSEEGGRINPSIGRSGDIIITKVIYHEKYGSRVLEYRYRPNPVLPIQDIDYVFKDYGENDTYEMLSIELPCFLDDVSTLWEIRKKWLVDLFDESHLANCFDLLYREISRIYLL